MIQQVANQFSEGINLDTNPIAMSNHQIKSALNATMITMNGNELVLQNDMGNARVESAYLPAGYVPVGIAEFGGIVYVASHNPLTNQSQIGCFPSPERNISSDEINESLNKCFYRFSDIAKAEQFYFLRKGELYIPSFAQKLGIKVDSPIRPGDKFSIEMSDPEEFSNLLELLDKKAMIIEPCTVNSDGAFVVINNLIEPYDYWINRNNINYEDNGGNHYQSFIYSRNVDGLERRYNVYKNKIVGDLYLKLTLNIPNNIPYYITGDQEGDWAYYTIHMPKVRHISKYRVYIVDENKSEFFIDVDTDGDKGNGFSVSTIEGTENQVVYYQGTSTDTTFKTLTFKFGKDVKNIHSYTIVPYFQPEGLDVYPENLDDNSGYLVNLACKGNIDLSKLGKGIINFTQFKYYNNTTDGIFTLNYSMEAYLKSSQFVESVDLCIVDYNQLLINGDLTNNSAIFTPESGLHIINIGGSQMSYFGNFQSSLSYDDELQQGKTYVAFLRASVHNMVNDNTTYKYSKPFLMFTSSISNYLFVSNMDSYIDASSGNNPHNQSPNETTNQLWDDYIGIPCNIDWKWSIQDKTNTVIETTGSVLPYDNENELIHYKSTKEGTIDYKLNPTITLRLGNDFPLDSSKIEAKFNSGSIKVNGGVYSYNPVLVGTHNSANLDSQLKNPVNEQECSGQFDITFDDGTLSCHTRLVSEFEAGTNKVKDSTVTGDAFVPLLEDHEQVLKQPLLLPSYQQETENNYQVLHYEITRWYNMRSRSGGHWHRSWRNVGMVDLTMNSSYVHTDDASSDNSGYIPDCSDDTVYTEGLYHLESEDAAWYKWINPFRDKFIEMYGQTPLIAFIQGVKGNGDGEGHGMFSSPLLQARVEDECIPMLMDQNGIYRPLNDIGHSESNSSHTSYVADLIQRYKDNCFIIQEDKTYTMSYQYVNSQDYIYSQPYSCDYQVQVEGMTEVSLGTQFPEDAIIQAQYSDNSVTLKSLLPSSAGYNELKNNLNNSETYMSTNALKLPKAALLDNNNQIKKYDSTIITISIDAPDIEDVVAGLLTEDRTLQGNPAMKNGFMVSSVDVLGEPLNRKYMYFLGNDGNLYSSRLVNQMTFVSSNKYEFSKDGATYYFENEYADLYKKLSKILEDEVLVVDRHTQYNQLSGLYINYNKAANLGYLTNNENVLPTKRKDLMGQKRDSMIIKGGGVNIALVGKADISTYEQESI